MANSQRTPRLQKITARSSGFGRCCDARQESARFEFVSQVCARMQLLSDRGRIHLRGPLCSSSSVPRSPRLSAHEPVTLELSSCLDRCSLCRLLCCCSPCALGILAGGWATCALAPGSKPQHVYTVRQPSAASDNAAHRRHLPAGSVHGRNCSDRRGPVLGPQLTVRIWMLPGSDLTHSRLV